MAQGGAPGEGPTDLGGRRLGEWIVGDAIGSGGFADVYLARQPRLERDAVIKVLRFADANPTRVKLFEREARLASQLDHPYAAHVYSFGIESDGLLWIAMELVRGKSLADIIRDDGPMPLARFVPVFERLCEVVESAHAVGLIHRDIKPANVMVVTRSGRLLPKLLDFGIAELIGTEAIAPTDDDERAEVIMADNIEDGWTLDTASDWSADTVTQTAGPTDIDGINRTAGTPAYMSPEQWLGSADIDHRTDVYSLAILAHQCLTGELPFRASSVREYFFLHQKEPPARLGPEFPAALADALRRGMAKNKRDRHESALDFGKAVSESVADANLELPRADATPWLLSAPSHLGDSLAAFEAVRGRPACERLGRFLHALAQWTGVLALAASAAKGARPIPEVATLRGSRLGARQWLDLAAAVAAPYSDSPEDFPIPELARWLAEDGGGREQLLALLAMSAEDREVSAAAVGLLRSLLASLRFLCNYATGAEDRPLVLTDGEGANLLVLEPLVVRAQPTPGAERELFVVAGADQGSMVMTAPPRDFELESETLGDWLTETFVLGDDVPALAVETNRSPYRGLAPFTSSDASLFFGRNRDVQSLYNRVVGSPFVALTGPSGSGKSSLVHAGLLPRLPDSWLQLRLRPGRDPLSSLRRGLEETLSCSEAAEVSAALEASGKKLLVALDQTEELLTMVSAEEADEFARRLTTMTATRRVHALLTIRDDFIAGASQLTGWREELSAGLVLVSAPSKEELYNMIVGPARRVGFEFSDDELAGEMVEAVATEKAALPLLSFAASRLWEHRDEDGKLLTRAAYKEMGGVAGALAKYAEEVLAALPTSRQGRVRKLFRRLVTKDGTRAVVRTSELASLSADREVVEHLVSARLLVAAEGEDGEETTSIVHEALLSEWPRLARWRAEDEGTVRLRSELSAATSTWREYDRDPSYLWRGAALRNLDSLDESDLSAREREFAAASRSASQRASRRRRQLVISAIAVLAAAVVVLVLVNRRSERNRVISEARLTEMLVSRGYAELVQQRSHRALIYLHAAYARGRDDRGLRLALSLATRNIESVRSRQRAHDGAAQGYFYHDAGIYLSTSPSEPIRIWKWNGDQFEKKGEFSHPDQRYLVLSEDAKRIVSAGDSGIRFWDGTGKPIKSVRRQLKTHIVFMHPDGKHVLTSWKEDLIAYTLDGDEAYRLGEGRRNADVFTLAMNESGTRIASGRSDSTLELWDEPARERLWRIKLSGPVSAMGFVADDKRLFMAFDKGRIGLVDVATGKLITERVIAESHVAISAYKDETRAMVRGLGSSISIVDMETLATIDSIPASEGLNLAFMSHDTSILVVFSGEVLRTFDAKSLKQLSVTNLGHTVLSASSGLDNESVIVATPEGELVTYNVAGRDYFPFTKHENIEGVRGLRNTGWSATFSPDGSEVASFDSHWLYRWRPDTGEVISKFELSTVAPRGMPQISYSNDGKTLLLPDRVMPTTFDVDTGMRLVRYSAKESTVMATDLGDNHVAVANVDTADGRAYMTIWDRETEALVVERQHKEIVHDLVLGPNDDNVVFFCGSSQLGRWNIAENRIAWSTRIVDCYDIDISDDGRFVTGVSRDGYTTVWHSSTGEIHRRLRSSTEVLYSVALSPNGKILAMGSIDFSVYLWDVEAGAAFARLVGHRNVPRRLDFSPDGRRLVSAGDGGAILVWPLESEERSPAELEELIRENVALELDGARVVPAKPTR